MAESSSSCSSTLKDLCEENKTSLWKIRKIITEKSEGPWLKFSDDEKYILKSLGESFNKVRRDPIKIKIDDYDTGYKHDAIFGYNHRSDQYYIGGLWRIKELVVGDEVGLFYDPIAKNLCFSVLKQAKPDDKKNKQNPDDQSELV